MSDGIKTFKCTERVWLVVRSVLGCSTLTAGFPPSKRNRSFWHTRLPAGGFRGVADWLVGWLAEMRREPDRWPSSSSHWGLWWLFLPQQEMPQMSNYSERLNPGSKSLLSECRLCYPWKRARLDAHLQNIASKLSHQTFSRLFLLPLCWWLGGCGSHKNRIRPYLYYFHVCAWWFLHSHTALVEDRSQHYDRLLNIVLVPLCCQNSKGGQSQSSPLN